MVPYHISWNKKKARFPRASGDGPERQHQQQGAKQFPPRERGWSLFEAGNVTVVNVSPARAGMVP